MNKEEIIEKLNGVFREVFDDEEIFIKEDTTANDIDDWDSLEHINLIVAVEQAFNVKFNMSEVTSMKNVGDMITLIASKIN